MDSWDTVSLPLEPLQYAGNGLPSILVIFLTLQVRFPLLFQGGKA